MGYQRSDVFHLWNVAGDDDLVFSKNLRRLPRDNLFVA